MAQSSSYELLQPASKTLHPRSSPSIGHRTTSTFIKPDAQRRIHPFLRDWWTEIASIVVSAVAFLAIVVTLQPHDKQPLPQWPYSISVNALVSIYVVVFKAAILFMVAESLSQLKWLWYRGHHPLQHVDIYDQASRGPWGSMLLLWSVAPRNLLAGAGALVTILMVIIDPFTQQLLAYYTCPWPVPEQQALIPSTTLLDHLGSVNKTVPPAWQSAINAGIFSPGQSIAAVCPSGNCTFTRPYGTLGWCSECTDVSRELTITDSIVNQFTYELDSTYYLEHGPDTFLSARVYNTTLPTDYFPYSKPNLHVYSVEGHKLCQYATMGSLATFAGAPFAVVLGKTYGQFQDAFMPDNSSCSNSADSKTWRCQGYGAARCSLFPCVKKINGSIQTGVLEEIVVDTSLRKDWGWGLHSGTPLSTIDVECLTTEERSGLQDDGFTIAPNQKWLAYNLTWDPSEKVAPNAPYPKSLQDHGCLFAYDYYTVFEKLCYGYLEKYFDGSLWGSTAYGDDTNLLHGPQVILQFFNWGNISFERTADIFTNISNSMTVLTRHSGNTNHSAPIVGVVYKDQTCLRVRWGWLSYPAVLALIAWAFFAATLWVQSGAQWIPSWKSSTLPMLLNGTVLNDGNSNGSEKDEMVKMARRVRVQLGLTDKGLGLAPSQSADVEDSNTKSNTRVVVESADE